MHCISGSNRWLVSPNKKGGISQESGNRQKPVVIDYHLFYTSWRLKQYIVTVKVYRVFPSIDEELHIFMQNSISLSQHWRQRGSRCAIHAGLNLPDKEFRYLRTVRVTAAVYQSLDSKLSLVLFASWHRAGFRPYTSSFDLAESCVFDKQSLPPILCHLLKVRRPSSSRSYRVILPSSFNVVFSYALVFSTHRPVSVSSTVRVFFIFFQPHFNW
jgi:hypothetical protein